jgi:hypothetical protein
MATGDWTASKPGYLGWAGGGNLTHPGLAREAAINPPGKEGGGRAGGVVTLVITAAIKKQSPLLRPKPVRIRTLSPERPGVPPGESRLCDNVFYKQIAPHGNLLGVLLLLPFARRAGRCLVSSECTRHRYLWTTPTLAHRPWLVREAQRIELSMLRNTKKYSYYCF